ncbi:MAG: hypothetical protein JW889_02180 [Verrucomicrobia bacterium]|nr:hypothetical protein [Verrucomicrobiota bacterium]
MTMRPLKTHRLLWHADKVAFGAAMLVCALAVVWFWTSSTPSREGPREPHGDFRTAGIAFPNLGDHKLPSIAVDLATDPDEYLPRPGEHSCIGPTCTCIMPDSMRYCPVCGIDQHDRDRDGMTDEWEQRYRATNPDVADADLDYDGDRFTNIEEYRGGSDPDDPQSIPGPVRLVAVDQEFVDALFRGFATRRSGATAIQINWGNDRATEILDIGQTFRGYTIERLDERVVLKRVANRHVAQTEYTLVLKRPDGAELKLPRHEPVREPESYGVFLSVDGTGSRKRAYAGETIRIGEHSYLVNEVSPHGARLTGDRGEKYNLELRPEERPR